MTIMIMVMVMMMITLMRTTMVVQVISTGLVAILHPSTKELPVVPHPRYESLFILATERKTHQNNWLPPGEMFGVRFLGGED